MMLMGAGREEEAKQQFLTAVRLDLGLTDVRRVLSDLQQGRKPPLIDRDPLDSPALHDLVPPGSWSGLDVSRIGEALRASDQTFFYIAPEVRLNGVSFHVRVIGGSELDLGQVRGAVANLGKIHEYPSMFFPEYNRTVWSFDLHTPRTLGSGTSLNGLPQSLSMLPGPKKIDFGGGGSSSGGTSGSGVGGMF
jgi:hypothetical protein